MAANAANFAFTTENRPSIFEIMAQKSLNETFHPALQRLALFLSTNCPQKFNWLGNYYNELFLVLNGGLQYNYLKYYDSTFSENFYGLKRVLSEDNSKLSDRDKKISLLFVVLLPYFKRKLDEKVNFYKLEEADGCLRNNFEGNLKKLLIFSHSTFEVSWNLLTIANYIKYMSRQSEAQLPILKLIGLKLTFGDPEDDTETFWGSLFRGQFRNLWRFAMFKNAFGGALEFLAFLLQFLQSWDAKKSNFSLTGLPTVKPPPLDNKAGNYLNKCPICLQHWKIPTVLPVSGYVFCFPCILRYLRENQKCPVTNLPAKPLDIVRLYDTE